MKIENGKQIPEVGDIYKRNGVIKVCVLHYYVSYEKYCCLISYQDRLDVLFLTKEDFYEMKYLGKAKNSLNSFFEV